MTYAEGKHYIIITGKDAGIYAKPDTSSNIIYRPRVGELFIHLEDQILPQDYTDLDPEMVEELEEHFKRMKDFREEYKEIPGILVDGYYNYWIKVIDNTHTGWVFRAYTFASTFKILSYLREIYFSGNNSSHCMVLY